MFQRYFYSVFLVVALLFANIGLAVNIHYCGNAIEKIEIGYASSIQCEEESHEKACCNEKKETTEDACCKDEIIKQKTDDVVVKVFQVQQFSSFISPTIYKLQPLVISSVKLPKKLDVAFYCESNAPPLYKLYNQYLLYA
ncbi:hypothetical protein H1R17_02825 [Flavobacterium sp. xlx-214]|uniref:HYC_CC_PP family protein n=1 Tax=unclassified Flavobacterium TaxID=196869 RepID=UPI0013D2D165|nr:MULTISPECIES: hypothetical protein [unclassified Flavobacterium]MBA5793352.1 hypothetical protein [Flavobacterium sp. xlx-221]QMI84086.1 hypothetical protein H1R17_02825 [Flavobacterium sp. xlx-214]